VTFLDVGQGDAAVSRPGARSCWSTAAACVTARSTRARVSSSRSCARGHRRVDVVALSHPHPDHMSGLFRIIERFPVGALWTSGDDGHNPEYGRLQSLPARLCRRRRSGDDRSAAPASNRWAVSGSHAGERIGAPGG
jgi:competence protein ComEC